MQRFEVKCFHKEREHWGRDKLTYMSSIITLKAIAVVGAQVPLQVTLQKKAQVEDEGPNIRLYTNLRKGHQKISERKSQ